MGFDHWETVLHELAFSPAFASGRVMPNVEEMALRAALVDAVTSLIEQQCALQAVLKVEGPELWEIHYGDTVNQIRARSPEPLRDLLDQFRELVLSYDERTPPAPDWKKAVQDLLLSVDEIDPPDNES